MKWKKIVAGWYVAGDGPYYHLRKSVLGWDVWKSAVERSYDSSKSYNRVAACDSLQSAKINADMLDAGID
jgi:hypothetical protein